LFPYHDPPQRARRNTRLLSWNVQWCRGVDGSVDPARIAREAKRLADPEVVCLQEVARGFTASLPGSRGEDLVAVLAREFAGYAYAFAWGVEVPDAHPRGGRSRFGNLTLPRLTALRIDAGPKASDHQPLTVELES
jgi:endonuclease/exonuclease/phosphatase family metal-dependent hydrolase